MCRTVDEIENKLEKALENQLFRLNSRESIISARQVLRHVLKEIINNHETGFEDIAKWINQPVGDKQIGVEFYHFQLEDACANVLRSKGWVCYLKK